MNCSFYSCWCIWEEEDVNAALQSNSSYSLKCSEKKKWLSPISFVKGLLKNERCPPPFFCFFLSQGHMSSCCLAGCLDEEEAEEEEEEPDAFIRCMTSPRANPLLRDTAAEFNMWDQNMFHNRGHRGAVKRVFPWLGGFDFWIFNLIWWLNKDRCDSTCWHLEPRCRIINWSSSR